MSIVILNAMEDGNNMAEILKGQLAKTGKPITCFGLKGMNILPCRSCGACGFKSPGKCVLKDDSHEVLKAIAECDAFVMLTPIRFGGYNSTLKKIVDKFMTLGLPLYMIKDGHLLHPMRYGSKFMIGVGVYDGDSRDQEDSFRRLVENNAFNMQSEYRTFILKPSWDMKKIEQEISSIGKEVC